MRFAIKGYREPEGVMSATFDASNIEDARAQAIEEGVRVLSIRREWRSGISPTRKSRFDLLRFSQEVHALLDAGLSIIESLSALSGKESSTERRALIDQLIRRLREGQAFSYALEERPDIFPPLYVSLVSASERTGDLSGALMRYIGYRSQMDTVRKKIKSAAIYPVLLIVVGGMVIVFLMAYVVPRFSRIYEDFGRDLPFLSKVLMQWGALVNGLGMQTLLIGCAVVGVIAYTFREQLSFRRLLDRLMASRPLRARVLNYELSRFFRTLGMLQQGGIPIITALDMAGGLLGPSLATSLQQATLDIKSGIPLSEALQRHDLAPPVAFDLLRVGEKTGDVGEKMVRIADFFDEDLAISLEWFSKLFEPLLMLGIGVFIACIVVLLYLPIFELAGNIQ